MTQTYLSLAEFEAALASDTIRLSSGPGGVGAELFFVVYVVLTATTEIARVPIA